MCDEMHNRFNVSLYCLKGEKRNLKNDFNLKNNFKVQILPSSSFKIINILIKLINVRKYKKKKNDIIFTRDVHFAFFSCFFYERIYLELHVDIINKRLLSYYFLKFLFRAKKVKIIFISNELCKIYKKKYKIKNRYIIAHDASDNHFKKSKTQSKKKISVGYCGHLYKGRGIETIIKLSKLEKNYNFNILGGFDSDRDRLFKNNIMPTNIKFFSHKKYSEVSKFLNLNDILIAPYSNKVNNNKNEIDISKYQSPLKVFEYMSARKSIVTSKKKNLEEIFTHKVDAILCKPNDIKEWHKALIKLRDKNLRVRLSDNAYKKFLKHYTWKKRIINIFD